MKTTTNDPGNAINVALLSYLQGLAHIKPGQKIYMDPGYLGFGVPWIFTVAHGYKVVRQCADGCLRSACVMGPNEIEYTPGVWQVTTTGMAVFDTCANAMNWKKILVGNLGGDIPIIRPCIYLKPNDNTFKYITPRVYWQYKEAPAGTVITPAVLI